MKQKELMVMTSFGPVPYEAIKEYLPKEVVELIKNSTEHLKVSYYIEKLANKKHRDPRDIYSLLVDLESINQMALINVLLKEIAVELDKQYEDHISNSENIFIVSSLDGKIHRICKSSIKSYRNFAAFRTLEDANTACTILKDYLKEAFSDRK